MKDDIIDKLESLAKLDGTLHDTKNSNIMWPSSTDPKSTPEEAVADARVDAIKKDKPFKEPRGTDVPKTSEDAINRYIDDMLEGFLGDG